MSDPGKDTTERTEHELIALSEVQRELLLSIARQSISAKLNGSNPKTTVPQEEALLQPAAVFVTLWRSPENDPVGDGEKTLRGCIGRLRPDAPLYLAVTQAAVSAATRDPRFLPVNAEELDELIIDISILSPLHEVQSLDEVVIGEHGLVIEADGRRGLLLPKVAPRLNWNRREFLENLHKKAGLPQDTWPQSGKLFRFRATEISE